MPKHKPRPKWRLFFRDETEYWPEIEAKGDLCVIAVYLFDANSHVYCCEMTPSYEMHEVGQYIYPKVGREKPTEGEYEDWHDYIDTYWKGMMNVSYFHVHTIQANEMHRFKPLPKDKDGKVLDARSDKLDEYVWEMGSGLSVFENELHRCIKSGEYKLPEVTKDEG